MKQTDFIFELVDDLLGTDWLQRMYNKNVLERQRHDETPYKDKEDYYRSNKDWLIKKYKGEQS